MKKYFALFFIFSISAQAENPVSVPLVVYELRSLQAQGISFYGSSPLQRKYLEFINVEGRHHIIYEESPDVAPLAEAINLQQAMGNLNAVCSIDIECTQKAFCTGDCRQMYYEVTNLPKEKVPLDHNRCKIQSFSCEKALPSYSAQVLGNSRAPASSVPAAALAPVSSAAGTTYKVPGGPSLTVPPPPPLDMVE